MKYIIAILLTLGVNIAQAEAIATMPNEGGGRVVLTNLPCEYKNKTYKNLNRAYTYTNSGINIEGCYGIEDDTVVAVWIVGSGSETRRYPISSFTLTARGKNI